MDRPVALVVDDEAMIRDIVVKILTKQGFAVMSVSGAEQAVMACSRSPEGIALAVIDMQLPKSGGRRAARQIHRMYPETVVLLTGVDVEVDVDRLLVDTGADGFVGKPYGSTQLMTAVQEAFEKRGAPAPGGAD
jgi:two-component system cell cycle sensor histidine kinase/response regulator CckA